MGRNNPAEAKGKTERQQTILRLIQEHPISRQEVLLEHLRQEGFEVTQATISRVACVTSKPSSRRCSRSTSCRLMGCS